MDQGNGDSHETLRVPACLWQPGGNRARRPCATVPRQPSAGNMRRSSVNANWVDGRLNPSLWRLLPDAVEDTLS